MRFFIIFISDCKYNTRYCITQFFKHNTNFHSAVIMHIFMDIYNTYIYVLFFHIISCFYVENLL